MRHFKRRSLNQRQGAVAVEFAMTAPLLFLILFGCLELGHANMVFNVAEAAAYEGAREGIVPGATAADVTAATQRLLNISRIRASQITVTPNNLGSNTESIRVTVEIPYNENAFVVPSFTKDLIIQRECTLTREGTSD